jgi:ABC-type branched-subunit amino acid transport system permease subunit
VAASISVAVLAEAGAALIAFGGDSLLKTRGDYLAIVTLASGCRQIHSGNIERSGPRGFWEWESVRRCRGVFLAGA